MSSNKKFDKNDLLDITFKGSKSSLNYPDRSTIKLDDKGVLIYKIPYSDSFDYYPIFMARFSLGNLEMFIQTDEKKYYNVFLDQVNWLFDNLKYKDGFAVWEHNYKFPFYDFDKTPWVHGLGQGLGMTALLKAYQLTNQKKYLSAAEKVLNSFDVDIKNGGVKYVDEKENIWFEEYALIPPPKVLNGFITILFSLYEFNRVTGSKKSIDLFDRGIKTVKLNLESYDSGYWSYYDLLRKYPCTYNYHRMHVWQLSVLYDLTNQKVFKKFQNKWDEYKKSYVNKKKASMYRGILHLRRYGVSGSIKRYFQRQRWEKED